MMCQHFSGQIIKRLLAAIQNPLATNTHFWNEAAGGYKKLRYIQTRTFSPLRALDNFRGKLIAKKLCNFFSWII